MIRIDINITYTYLHAPPLILSMMERTEISRGIPIGRSRREASSCRLVHFLFLSSPMQKRIGEVSKCLAECDWVSKRERNQNGAELRNMWKSDKPKVAVQRQVERVSDCGSF